METKTARRRLIQSTLFPRAAGSPTKQGQNCDGVEEVAAEEDEEWCESSKKRRESKRKPKAAAPRAKVTENGKETSSSQIDDSYSPVIAKSNFFVKASERRQQKSQQNQLVLIDSPEKNNVICSPPSSVANGSSTPRKQKRQDNSTPRKGKRSSTPNKKMKNDKKELCCPIPFDLAENEQLIQTIPDLRLEAKLSSEENSRLFSGRQIHPFFTSRRGTKSSNDSADSESKWSSFEREEKGNAFHPIHVFENVEGDNETLNWGHWIFSERSATDDLECGCLPVYEGSADSLNFDNFLNGSHFTRTSLYQNSEQCSVPQRESFMRLPNAPELSHPHSSSIFDDNREKCNEQEMDSHMLPKDAEEMNPASVELMLQDCKNEKNELFDGIPCGERLGSDLQNRLLQQWIMSHYHASQNQPKNCLWTDKYQPQNAEQICGNGESVKFLSEWLRLWHKSGSVTSKLCFDEEKSMVQDNDHDYQQSDSDTDNEEESLKNVLLVTGPAGSGKSAAIYACARDQGFQIIEINASDWRNGALLKQKFGEAVESHWLQRQVENATNSDYSTQSKFCEVVNVETRSSDNEVTELLHLPDKGDSQDAGPLSCISVSRHKRNANNQKEIKTLILFEDVDVTLCEDHGFITTIQQFAETAKRPMILTSNSDNPALPKNLDRSELNFSVPSLQELLGLVYMICAAEKTNIHPCVIERFVDHCQRDIRKTILLLQFWCQGQTLVRGKELHLTYRPVLFDLDAGHHILPKIIHWSYPSKLSDLVAEEIHKSLTITEETHALMDTNMVEDLNDYTRAYINMQDAEPDPVEVKKEAMLSLQSSLLDEVECMRFEAKFELSDTPCSPVAFSRKNSRRKVNTVLSSDSEDEFSFGNTPLVSAGDFDAEKLDMENMPTSHRLSTELYNLRTEPIFNSSVDKLEEDCYNLPERIDCFHIEDTCNSQDMSVVPESSFVPETEIIDETELYSTTVSYGHFVNSAGATSVFQDHDSIPTLEHTVDAQVTSSLHILRNDEETLHTSIACVYQEEVGDSLSKYEADVPQGYQMLDECSRVDFMRRLKSLDNPPEDQPTDFIKETWKRLRDQCKDLQKYVTAEEKTACQALVFAHGMSNLISEADLLLNGCQTLAFDSLESSMISSEKTHSYNYYDNQLEMSSVLAQHGMCFYAKEIASLGSVMESTNTLDLASEMLSSSTSSVALGKLACQDQRKVDASNTKVTKSTNLLTSKSDSCLCNVLESIVPSKSFLAAKGDTFHEYISTLSQISRFEASRLSECINSGRKQRRARLPQHYLGSGSLAMTSEEISLVGRYNSYQKSSFYHRGRY